MWYHCACIDRTRINTWGSCNVCVPVPELCNGTHCAPWPRPLPPALKSFSVQQSEMQQQPTTTSITHGIHLEKCCEHLPHEHLCLDGASRCPWRSCQTPLMVFFVVNSDRNYFRFGEKKVWERERVALMENPGSLMAQQWDKRLQPHSHIQRSSLIFTLSHSKGLWFQPPTIRNAIELPVERNSIVLIVGYFQ